MSPDDTDQPHRRHGRGYRRAMFGVGLPEMIIILLVLLGLVALVTFIASSAATRRRD